MLCELYIENLAVIEKTSIKFEAGFNVFTGETGAGKSIVIDAINAVLGQRSSKEIVRHNTNKATVIATFSDLSPQVIQKLKELEYDVYDDELIIKREISVDGKSSARVMGKPITVGMLKEIGNVLINIHGQHDSQILLSPEKHIDILDKYGEHQDVFNEYYECYKSVVLIKREIKKLTCNEDEKVQKIDLLSYQINEIEESIFTDEEEDQLQNKRLEIKNHAKIFNNLAIAMENLRGNDGDGGAVECLRIAKDNTNEILDVYDPITEIATQIESIFYETQEIANEILSMIEGCETGGFDINEVENRLEEIHSLKRKYGSNESLVTEFLSNAKSELTGITTSDERLLELGKQGTQEFERLLKLGVELTNQRQIASERFVKCITEELVFLDMPNVKLQVQITQQKPSLKGQDIVEFLISTNKGEPPKSIAKIASGGELSRIMLAIKNTLADKDEIQTLIFDEIDSGVSGQAAQKIGLKLKQAGKNRQIISVTHSAQIAALADNHLLIKKSSVGENTFTEVETLDLNGRINAVAKIMGTDKVTDLMIENAKEMILSGE